MAPHRRPVARGVRCAVAALAAAAASQLAQARLTALELSCQSLRRPAELPCGCLAGRAPVALPPEVVLGTAAGDTELFSGYVNVTQQDYLFYFFAHGARNLPPDAPLIVWSGGGPGCSAMEAATVESGPLILFDVKQGSSMFSRRLAKNPYSWTRFAHVLYVDQPRYVGYSVGTGPPAMSSEEAGRDMVAFLRGWQRLFPEHASRKLIFASDAYGARLVSAWAAAALDDAERSAQPLPLRGIVLGSAFIDSQLQGDASLRDFARQEGLLPEDAAASGAAPATRGEMESFLGYKANAYDYRLKDTECCGCAAYNYAAWTGFLTMESVVSALHVCGGAGHKAFGDCGSGCLDLLGLGFDSAAPAFDAAAALGRALGQGIPVLLYYGMQDTAVNHAGGLAAAASLRWPGARSFAAAALEPLRVAGAAAGQVQTGGGLTYARIQAAGHMVAADQPAAVAQLVGELVKQATGQRSRPREMLRYT